LVPVALVVLGLAYGGYLAAGGNLGREWVKAKVARGRADATFTLRDNATGGDCAQLGSWNDSTRTCTLGGDPAPESTILIRDDGITLDGAGRRMTGGKQGLAVQVFGSSRVTIRNLTVQGYASAVYLQHATHNTVSNLTVGGTSMHSIHLTGNADFNAIINNDVGPSVIHGIGLWSSSGNFIANNRIHRVRDGIRLQSSHGNVIVLNEVTDAEIEGVDLHLSRDNRVMLNNLMGSTPIPVLDDVGESLYHLGSGGNYYQKLDTTTGGCPDSAGDGFCDREYKFAIGRDPRALARPVPTISGSR
jgi:parallel beta-helix repeat protein